MVKLEHMSHIDTDHFKQQLQEEKQELKEDLSHLGRVNPDNPKDWEAVKKDLNVLESDSNVLSDEIEQYEEDSAILGDLEARLAEVNHALNKINGEADTAYGICEVSGKQIPKKRLEANPAARAHVEHTDQLKPLYPDTDT
jgi:RNA polymerase-binding transcription factor DksA